LVFPRSELIPFAVFTVAGEPSIFIPRHASGPALIELVFALDELALRRGNVSRKSEQEVVGNSLLHGDTSARIGVVSA
jgi:ABC-type microcin C transport system permease subunit YejB